MHKSVVFKWMLGGFLGGVALASFLVMPNWLLWVAFALGLTGLISQRPILVVGGAISLALVLGLWRTTKILDRPSRIWELAGEKATVALVGYVDGDFTPTKTGGQYQFHVAKVNGESVYDRVTVFGPATLQPLYGQVYELTGKLQRPNDSEDFDYASYLAKSGIHGIMYFPQYSVPLDWGPSWSLKSRLTIIGWLHGLRDSLSDSVNRSVKLPESAYLSGILVGAKGIVPDDIKEMFSRTGTSHILAISGYNITIVAGVLSVLLAPIGRRRSFWFATAGVAAFTILVGASASIVRAAIMGVMALAARQFGRQAESGILILLSAAVMCAINPLLLRWDVGFQLSFLALIGIVYIVPLLACPAGKGSVDAFGILRLTGWKASLWNMIATTASASLMVLPLLLYDFGQLAVYTLPTNILVLPLVPLAMALGFTTAITGAIVPLLGQIIGQLAWLVAALQLRIIRFFSSLPFASIEVHISWIALASAYIAIATWLVLTYRKRGTEITT